MSDSVIEELAAILGGKGARPYGLHDVNQLEHALQAAWLAEQDGAAAPLIAAALLHDIGHMVADLGENPAETGVDDRHEALGDAWLRTHFGPEVTEPVRLHVAAKRFLCATEPGYYALLSPDSVLSLSLQGGPMSAAEAEAFGALPHAAEAVRLRRYDEAAKVKALETPKLGHFLQYVAECLPARG
jgi:phosphonate degradation associated HDIG domain protein